LQYKDFKTSKIMQFFQNFKIKQVIKLLTRYPKT